MEVTKKIENPFTSADYFDSLINVDGNFYGYAVNVTNVEGLTSDRIDGVLVFIPHINRTDIVPSEGEAS